MNTLGIRLWLSLVLLALPVAADDALDQALAQVGLDRASLGWTPRAHWTRYPADIPYKLRHFDGLLAEPLSTVRYARGHANAARRFLSPAALAKPGERGEGALYSLVHALGVSPRFGAFRAYSANLTAPPTPLDAAILDLHRTAGRATRHYTFGTDSPYPQLDKALAAQVALVPEAARSILGQLVSEVAIAHRWATLAFRRTTLEARIAVAKRLDLGEEEVDALDYAPEVDDLARDWDEASLWYAALRATDALDRARRELSALKDVPAFAFDWETPWGMIRLRGTGTDEIDARNALLLVDLGGDDVYLGPAGSSAPDRPIGLVLDLGGDDRYLADVPAHGAGVCGVGIVLDQAGNDRYESHTLGQGAGQFGLGALLDLAGDDRYAMRYSGQGCGYFGIGVLADALGNDRYELWSDGQGFGGVAGVGTLADGAGDDVYVAVRDPAITKRPSYHSELKVSVSNAQGCAMGRRGDGADGHSWAGGLGMLLDVSGNDSYLAGNWSMGTGYWFGTGLLWDGDGNDAYHGVVWSQGSGAHFCVGALVDEAGDDEHALDPGGRTGLAFGHDFTVALLVDVKGNDRYTTAGDGLGMSINRSVALLLDLAGDDHYAGPAERRPGQALFDERLRDLGGASSFFAEASSLGLFLDVGGTDRYAPERTNDAVWLDPADSPNWVVRNLSVGVDRATGDVDLEPRPERPVPLRAAGRDAGAGSGSR